MPDHPNPYQAPVWLPGGHAQTIYSALFTPRPQVYYRRERWDTPDGDIINLDWVDSARGGPLVVLFHGLEGSSASPYAVSLMAAVARRGWAGVVVHFRGCGGEPNRLPRAYHSGDSAEIGWILNRLRAMWHNAPRYAVGVSLGGNALIKWLGEQREQAGAVLNAAAAVSAPLDLRAAGDHLAHGFNRLYTHHFLRTLKPKSSAMLTRHPGLFDRRALLAAHTMRQFDNCVTAPLHGFRDTDDYWRRASGKPWLSTIRVPTLLINARNDPFMPAGVLPNPAEVSTSVSLEFPATGGHVGFVSGAFPGHLDWLPGRILHFFAQQPAALHPLLQPGDSTAIQPL